MPRKSTKTSSFGSPGRSGHDATAFYAARLYEDQPQAEKLEYVENAIPPERLNKIFNGSAERMAELPDSSVHLMVTSPPYNVGKDYDEDLRLDEYLAFLNRVWAEVYRVLVPGGRACINIANLGRKPYIPLHTYIARDMNELGFLMRGEIIWDKGASASASTAWGSWQSAGLLDLQREADLDVGAVAHSRDRQLARLGGEGQPSPVLTIGKARRRCGEQPHDLLIPRPQCQAARECLEPGCRRR